MSETKKPAVAHCWEYDAGKLVINRYEASELRIPGGAIRLEGKNLPARVLVVCGENEATSVLILLNNIRVMVD